MKHTWRALDVEPRHAQLASRSAIAHVAGSAWLSGESRVALKVVELRKTLKS